MGLMDYAHDAFSVIAILLWPSLPHRPKLGYSEAKHILN